LIKKKLGSATNHKKKRVGESHKTNFPFILSHGEKGEENPLSTGEGWRTQKKHTDSAGRGKSNTLPMIKKVGGGRGLKKGAMLSHHPYHLLRKNFLDSASRSLEGKKGKPFNLCKKEGGEKRPFFPKLETKSMNLLLTYSGERACIWIGEKTETNIYDIRRSGWGLGIDGKRKRNRERRERNLSLR